MSARDNILRRLQAGSESSAPRPASADFCQPLPDVAAYYATHRRTEDAAERLARFTAAIGAAHAEVHDTDVVGWPARLCEIATAKNLRTLLVAAEAADTPQLEAAASAGPQLVRYEHAVDTWRNELFSGIDAGLTRARSAIAETGSLVLWPGHGEPRLLSLVPPVHFVLLDAQAIHADLHSAMMAEAWAGRLPTNALLVSGPSKTADIQQTLAYGAHGPRELVVLVVHPLGGHA